MSIVSCLALVSAVVALAAAPANGGTPEETTRARELFRAGQVHYDLKEYGQALEEFKDAYRVIQDPVLLFNIAQCHWMLGQNQEALGFYRNYLRRAPQAANRAAVEKRVQEIERDMQSGHKATTPSPPATTAEPSPAVGPVTLPRLPATAAPLTMAERVPSPGTGREARPVYRRWWFWTGVGVVVVGAVVAAVALSGRGEIGDCGGLSPCRTVGK